MSFQEDLLKNREAYRLLQGMVSQEKTDWNKPVASTVSCQEWDALDDASFAARIQEMNLQDGRGISRSEPVAEPVRYSLDGPLPGVSVWTEEQLAPSVFSQQKRAQGMAASISSVISPEIPAVVEDGTEREDLLDTLLQQLETNARRYPQDLGGKE